MQLRQALFAALLLPAVVLVPLALSSAACRSALGPRSGIAQDAEELRRLERERLRALVEADVVAARHLHAEDFDLINPAGVAFSREEYLGQIGSGQLDYRAWEPGEIEVRIDGDLALVRYRDLRFDVDWESRPIHRGPMTHTNLYERRDGRWQIVLSQASGVITPPEE